jgi:hypothetical protein
MAQLLPGKIVTTIAMLRWRSAVPSSQTGAARVLA